MEILTRHIIGFALFLCCTGSIFSQEQSSDVIYSKLDSFLEEPSPENLLKLKISIENSSASDLETLTATTIAYCNIGYIEAQNGALQNAIDAYEKAKQHYFSYPKNNYNIIEYCLKPLGNLYIKTQAFSEAENIIKQYILYAGETIQPEQEMSGITNLSVLYYNRGEFERAKNLLLQALEKSPSNIDLKLNLASVYFALNQKEKAKEQAATILKLAPQNIGVHQLLAQIQLSENEFEHAISNLKNALKLLQQNPETRIREMAKIHLSLAETYLAAGQTSNSISEIREVYTLLIPSYKKEQELPKVEQLYAETALMDALDLHAKIYFKQEKCSKTMAALDLATEVNNLIFAQLYLQDSRLLAQTSVKRRSEMKMELFFSQFETTKNQEWLEKAIQLDGKIKGRIVWEAVAFKEKLHSNFNKESFQFQQLQQELIALGNQIQKHINKNDIDPNELMILQNRYSRTLTEQRILFDRIQSNTKKISQQDLAVNLEKIKNKAISKNETLVSYFIGSETIYQFIISKKTTEFKKLVHTEKEYQAFLEAIRSFNRFFNDSGSINNDIPLFSTTSLELYNKLQLPKAENIVLIPDGILSFVPFQTLLTKESRTTQYVEMPFLLFESAISNAISFSDYLKNTSVFDGKQQVLGIFPVFKNTPKELGFSIFEAESIAKLFPTDLFLEEEATTVNFIENAGSHSILHISTHALGGTFSSEPSLEFYDRAFSVEELYGLQFSSELVVLSACETGVGKVIKGEGVLNLARGFRYAGAPNLLFSLWQVNDKSTAEWMRYYYQNLKETRSRNVSLHKGSLDYLHDETIDNTRKSPYYWGAFVYYGATDLPEKSATINWFFVLVGTIILIGMAALYIKRERKNT